MQQSDAPEGRSTVHAQDAVPPSKIAPPLSTSSTPGPALSRPTPVIASVPIPRVEGLLSQPTTRTNSPLPPVARGCHTPPARPTNDPAPDYFSKDAVRSHSIDNTRLFSRDQSELTVSPRYAREFVDNARKGLYGSSAVVDESQGAPLSNALGWASAPSTASKDAPGPITHSQSERPATMHTEYPTYPNQSFAALQKQIYPPYHPAPYNSRTYPSPHTQPFLSQLRTTFSAHSDLLHGRKSRTVANTPAQTPSLFTPNSATSFHSHPHSHAYVFDGSEEASPYPSPYLHPVQPQPPRTVTNAKKDVDVFSGRKIINHYEILDELGRGVHGKVKLARDLETGEQVAIKIVQRYSKKKRLGKISSPEDKVKKEVAILKKAQHPNVVRMLEVIDDPQEAKVYIVLEFCELKEIAWRTLGSSEIVLLENRRLDRESRGLPEEDVQTQEDKAFRSAIRRLEKTRSQPIRAQRARSASHLWSLEYGGESEDDDFGAEETTQERSGDEPSFATAADAEALTDELERISSVQSLSRSPTAIRTSRRPSTSPNDVMLSAKETNFGSFDSLNPSSFSSQWQRWSMPMSPDPIEESRGRRKGSVAESVTSQMTQFVQDEIPEEFRYVPTMTIPECRAAFRDALIGLDYLHYHGIIHRDIKPANLLRTRDYRVKISDFGVSYLGKPIRDGEESADTSESESKDVEDEAELAKNVGTPAFYAPELCALDLAADAPAVTGQIDVWALGATLYCLLFARTPFHADNEFALMRRIATGNIFIPRQRLKAVDLRTSIRSPSLGSIYGHHTDKRLPGEYQHERIDDELYDLLKKLFEKEPKRRITIKEIKYHPWVLHEIANPAAWLDDTDPSRQEEGRKIEISSKEVEDAVIPINFVKRIKSITSRAGRALGFSSSRTGRRRGHSSANSSEAGSAVASVTSFPDTVKDQRTSHRVDESIFAALKASRDFRERDFSEHPLSRSVTASPSPESVRDAEDVSFVSSAPHSPDDEITYRPSMPERHASEISTTASIRTIRPFDGRQRPSSDMHIPSDFPGAPQTILEHPVTAPALASLWSGSGRGLTRAMRAKDSLSPDVPVRGHHHAAEHCEETLYGEPSVALSNTSVTGHVDQASVLRKTSLTGSAFASPVSSRKSSIAGSLTGSRTSSPRPRGDSIRPSASASPTHQRAPSVDIDQQRRISVDLDEEIPRLMPESHEPQEQLFDHAYEALSRRRLLEIEQTREQENASRNASRPSTALGETAMCPPSPDDDPKQTPDYNSPSTVQHRNYFSGDHSFSPPLPSNIQTISSASSEDQLTSALSQSTSYPSIPSVISAGTSLPEAEYAEKPTMESNSSSEGTINTGNAGFRIDSDDFSSDMDADDAYAVDTDEDDEDSDADDGFLIMGRKSNPHASSRSGNASNTHTSRRRQTVLRQKRSSRSGSTNTMKKMRSDSSGAVEP